MQSPLLFVNECVISSRAGLVMGAPVNTMHWGLQEEKETVFDQGCVYPELLSISFQTLPEIFHMIFHCS